MVESDFYERDGMEWSTFASVFTLEVGTDYFVPIGGGVGEGLG